MGVSLGKTLQSPSLVPYKYFFLQVQILRIFKKTWGLKFSVLFFCTSESDKRMDFIIVLYFDDGQVTASVLDRYTLYIYFGC